MKSKAFSVINSEHHCTLETVAAELQVTRERVRQIELKALVKLRQGLARRGYPAVDLVEALRHLDGTRW